MKSYEAIRDILVREGANAYDISRLIRRTRTYVINIISRKLDTRVSTLVEILDALGYDLVARSREDGFEFDIDS